MNGNEEAPLNQRFLECQHPSDSFKFLILELIKLKTGYILDMKCLLQREAFWTLRLKIITPCGLSVAIDFLHVL